MMIGTADEIVRAPEKSPVFVEDLPEEEQAAALVRMAFPLCAYIRCRLSGLDLKLLIPQCL